MSANNSIITNLNTSNLDTSKLNTSKLNSLKSKIYKINNIANINQHNRAG